MLRFGARVVPLGATTAARRWGAAAAGSSCSSSTRGPAAFLGTRSLFSRCFATRSFVCRDAAAASAAKPSAEAAAEAALPKYTVPPHNRSVAHWLYFSAAVVGGVVWFGGVTRLTDSGLSIVQWKPISGIRPPLTHQEWEGEFDNYKQYPQYKQWTDMTLNEFKFIFFWEWAHRVLARSLGVVFGVPLVYYAARGRFRGNGRFLAGLVGILGLGGAQGFMGWYMVRSGLDNKLLEERKKATVSAYRLASHLCLAFLIFSFMLRMGYGLKLPKCPAFARKPQVQTWARISCGTMFATAMSGAFVAGLDAGLMYNDGFPLMAGGIIPPMDHLFALQPTWRNFFENHSMVQTVHRLMAFATTVSIFALNSAAARRKGFVPKPVKSAIMWVNGLLIAQVSLGMWTVISAVDIPIAASHQIGALLLLTSLIRLCAVLGSRGTLLA